jgi:hypothetical protein
MPLSQIVAHLHQILNESAGEQPLSRLTEKLYKLPGSKLALQNQGCKMRALIEKYPDLFVYIDDGGGGKVRLAARLSLVAEGAGATSNHVQVKLRKDGQNTMASLKGSMKVQSREALNQRSAMDHFEDIAAGDSSEDEQDTSDEEGSGDDRSDAEDRQHSKPHSESTFEYADAMADFFFDESSAEKCRLSKQSLVWHSKARQLGWKEFALFGNLCHTDRNNDGTRTRENHMGFTEGIALNVHEPFCMITMGVQGSGKSHTIGALVESCLVPAAPYVNLRTPMCALVLHYDKAVRNVCECASLALPGIKAFRHLQSKGSIDSSTQPLNLRNGDITLPAVKKTVILTSPCFYKQRKEMYRDMPNTEVHPLLFRWHDLQAAQLKILMRIKETDSQLYVGVMLGLLRRFQRSAEIPVYEDFKKKIVEGMNGPSQMGPLQQRLDLLDALVAESEENR